MAFVSWVVRNDAQNDKNVQDSQLIKKKKIKYHSLDPPYPAWAWIKSYNWEYLPARGSGLKNTATGN